MVYRSYRDRRFFVLLLLGLLPGWGLAKGWQQERVLGGAGFQHAGTVSEIVPLPDGKRVLTAADDGSARMWDLESGKELMRYVRKDSDTFWGVRALPGGAQILTAGSGGFATRWDLATGKKLMSYEHSGTVYRLALRPGGKEFVAVDNSNFAVLWDVETGKKLQTFKGHTDSVYSAVFISGGERLLTGGSDGKLKLWNVETGKCEKTLKENFEEIYTIALSPDEKRIVLCSDDERVCVYEAETLKLVWSEKDSGEMSVVTWSPDGTRVAAANNDEKLFVWDAETGEELKKISLPGNSHRGVSFSVDGKELFSGCDGVLCRYSVASGKRVVPTMGLPVLDGGIEEIALTSDGGLALAQGDGATVQAWETKTGKTAQRFDAPDDSSSMALSPDGELLALGGSGGSVALVEVETGNQVRMLVCENGGGGRGGNVFRGGAGSLAFDDAGERLVASSSGPQGVLWDVKTGKQLQVFSGHEDSINDIAFASGDETVITVSDDKTVRMWDVRTGNEVDKMELKDEAAELVVSLEGGRSFLINDSDEKIYGFLSSPKEEVRTLDRATVSALVEELGADKFAERQAASEKLIQQGSAVLTILDALKPDDPEVVFRLREIRSEIRKGDIGGDLKLLHSCDESIEAMATHGKGVHWAAVVGEGASARVVIGVVEEGALKVVEDITDGHGPEEVIFSLDGQTLLAGNGDGTVSVFRME
jgi:WD40 repeat protein